MLALLLTCAVVVPSDISDLLEPSDISDISSVDIMPVEPKSSPSVREMTLLEETAKEGEGAQVTIWDKSFSRAQVSIAQKRLQQILETLGRRRPEILGEAAT